MGCRRVIQVRLWDQSPGGEGTSRGSGEVTWQRAERAQAETRVVSLRGKEKMTPRALGPISPSCNDRRDLPLELENRTHLDLFSDKFFAT